MAIEDRKYILYTYNLHNTSTDEVSVEICVNNPNHLSCSRNNIIISDVVRIHFVADFLAVVEQFCPLLAAQNERHIL